VGNPMAHSKPKAVPSPRESHGERVAAGRMRGALRDALQLRWPLIRRCAPPSPRCAGRRKNCIHAVRNCTQHSKPEAVPSPRASHGERVAAGRVRGALRDALQLRWPLIRRCAPPSPRCAGRRETPVAMTVKSGEKSREYLLMPAPAPASPTAAASMTASARSREPGSPLHAAYACRYPDPRHRSVANRC
jgi:hypothetical protein